MRNVHLDTPHGNISCEAMDGEDQPNSQLAISHDPLSPRSPCPAKRPRLNPLRENDAAVICIEDDEPLELSQVSPNKPPRAPMAANQPLIYILSDSDEDEIVQIPAPVLTAPRRALVQSDGKRVPRGAAACRSPAAKTPEIQPKVPQLPNELTGAPSKALTLLQKSENVFEKGKPPAIADVQIPDDFEFPSPPPSSSDEFDGSKVDEDFAKPQTNVHTTDVLPPQNSGMNPQRNQERRPKLIEDFAPSVLSQDSAYFSFSRQSISEKENNLSPESQTDIRFKAEPKAETLEDRQPRRDPYYTKAFDYVLTEVLARYRDVLRPGEVELATSMRRDLSRDGLALFVRIYRRKQPQWYRTIHLHATYETDVDVDAGLTELCAQGLIISSVQAAKAGKKVTQLVARELVKTLRAQEMKAVLSSVSDSDSLKKLRRRQLLPALQKILIEESFRPSGRKKFKQATLTGLSQADCLSRAILNRAGHSIKIPEHVLEQLRRIHFLFFLEDGHDSPNVILADTRKAKFPEYECRPKNRIFPSCFAFEDFESALSLEGRLDGALECKDYVKAAHYGSIAELEVREYLAYATDGDGLEARSKSELAPVQCSPAYSSTGNARMGSIRSEQRKMLDRKEASMQLKHPFFRRYTAQWVYVRTAWHSVNALERLGEYEVAVQMLRLLLSTGLVPRRRGKCLNRLTINLFKHLGKLRGALDVILSALREEAPLLHFGDRIALANRGITIHRKLALPSAEDKAKRTIQKKSDRKKAAAADVMESRPSVLVQCLLKAATEIKVRKIFGKSLQIAGRERKRILDETRKDPWETFKAEDSRDSVASTTTQESAVLGKSKYSSLGSNRAVVTVENYCLEWYLGKEGWFGVHDEGNSLRFLYSLLFWECALFAPVEDVFQTPYQDRPLDLFTEAFYSSRRLKIDEQLECLSRMDPQGLRDEVLRLYTKHENVRAIGCVWTNYSAEDLSHIAAGLGGRVLSHCCKLLSEDYAYWGGGLPDLTLWKTHGIPGNETFDTRFVEVKSHRDTLSERQRAWLVEFKSMSADCEVCKVVEKVTGRNASELELTTLDSLEIGAIDAANSMDDPES